MSRPAVLLDRDGTINRRAAPQRYITDSAELVLLPGAAEAVARLGAAGFEPVVVSNQRGIARGLVTWQTLSEIEARIQAELARYGVRIAAFYYCPHDLADDCACRKPRPGMLIDAARDLDLDLGASWMIGDSPSDIAAGDAAGCRTALIGDEPSASTLRAASLACAAEQILAGVG